MSIVKRRVAMHLHAPLLSRPALTVCNPVWACGSSHWQGTASSSKGTGWSRLRGAKNSNRLTQSTHTHDLYAQLRTVL